MTIHWMSAFIDLPAATRDAGESFWCEATGSSLSERWGAEREFVTLRPEHGDRYLYVQRLGSGDGRVHPDLHVADPAAAAARARDLGAAVVATQTDLVVCASPGGLPFCLVRHDPGQHAVPPPASWPGGHRSRPDQICVDVPPESFDRELAFWAALTGWRRTTTDVHEFRRLLPPPGLPLHFLLQRLDSAEGHPRTRAHLDFSCSDVPAETARHSALGAAAVRRHRHWQVMRDPAGLEYCLTDKDPNGAWLDHAQTADAP